MLRLKDIENMLERLDASVDMVNALARPAGTEEAREWNDGLSSITPDAVISLTLLDMRDLLKEYSVLATTYARLRTALKGLADGKGLE